MDPPANASTAAGKVKGRMQHAVQAAAASAVTVAAPAILPPVVSFVAQAQPGEFSDGSVQDGPMTLM